MRPPSGPHIQLMGPFCHNKAALLAARRRGHHWHDHNPIPTTTHNGLQKLTNTSSDIDTKDYRNTLADKYRRSSTSFSTQNTFQELLKEHVRIYPTVMDYHNTVRNIYICNHTVMHCSEVVTTFLCKEEAKNLSVPAF